MRVPFIDLKAHHAPFREEFRDAIDKVIDSCEFAGGPRVEEFENDFATFCETKYAIGVGSGTEALWLALIALGVGPGDEVITVPSTFLATAEAITYCGARPVFVDIDECSYTMDPTALERAISPKTKAIIPVHLFGQTADMDAILEVANKNALPVIEDACQAHGALYKGRKAGSLSSIGCFSFYPGKNLGALGEAGAVVTNNDELQAKLRILRDHGQIRKYHHSMVGWNGRMDGIQAVVLRIKLRQLTMANEMRRNHAKSYTDLLRELSGVILPYEGPDRHHVYHIYSIRVQKRDDMIRTLQNQGVCAGIHYPIPVHLQEAYLDLGYERGTFPVAEKCANEFLSLPMFPELTQEQIQFVATTVRDSMASDVAA